MKRVLTSLAALTALTAAAAAADLPRRMPPVFTPVPVFTWTGFYAGVNAGYAFDVRDIDPNYYYASTSALYPPYYYNTSTNYGRDGFTGGGQVGYNYQFTPGSGVVVGIEADAQYIDLGRKRHDGYGGYPYYGYGYGTGTGSSGLDFFGTVRGRLGYAFDRVLFYGTGGFAYGSGERDANPYGYYPPVYAASSSYYSPYYGKKDDSFRTGYAVGAGIEYALSPGWLLNLFGSSAVTLKLEALYVNLEHKNASSYVSYPSPSPGLASSYYGSGCGGYGYGSGSCKGGSEFAVIRAGLNFKFGTF